MKTLLVFVFLFLTAPLTMGQAHSGTDKNAAVKEELRKLLMELNDARTKRDRAALERIYADEFLFVHASGAVANKTQNINEAMSVTGNVTPLPLPSFEQLHVYADVALLRTQETGRQTTSIYAKKGGRWQIVQLQGTLLQPNRKSFQLTPALMSTLVGKYENTSGNSLVIMQEGEMLVLQLAGIPKRFLTPTSETHFMLERMNAELTFHKNGQGHITHFIYKTANGREIEWKKVE